MSAQLDVITYEIELDFLTSGEITLNFVDGRFINVYNNGTRVTQTKALDFVNGNGTTAIVTLSNGRSLVSHGLGGTLNQNTQISGAGTYSFTIGDISDTSKQLSGFSSVVKSGGESYTSVETSNPTFLYLRSTGTTRANLQSANGILLNAIDGSILLNSVVGNVTLAAVNAITSTGSKHSFTPAAGYAGLNVGSLAGNPSSLANGDLWYNSSSNELNARINGSTVALGGGSGSGGWLLASGGTLTGNNNILGAGTYELQLGTTASKLNYFALNSEYIDVNSDSDINFIGNTFNVGRPSGAYPILNLYSNNFDVQTAALASQRTSLNLANTSAQIKTSRATANGAQGYVSSYLTGASDAGSEIGAFSASFATSTIFQVWSTGNARMGSTVAGFPGIVYENDYTANFGTRSLIDKGYALATFQPLDADLTTIAGLTATTDNFIVSVSSAWASRTPAQVRTTLGLDTWANLVSTVTGTAPYRGLNGTSTMTGNVTDAFAGNTWSITSTGTTATFATISSSTLTSGTGFMVDITGTAATTGNKAMYGKQSGVNGVGSQTTYAGYFENIRTGSGTNIGLYATASGGSSNIPGWFTKSDNASAPMIVLQNTSGGSSAQTRIQFFNDLTGTTTTDGGAIGYLSSAGFDPSAMFIYNFESTNMLFGTNNTTALTIDPFQRIQHVTASTSSANGISSTQNGLTSGNGIYISSTSLTTGNLAKFESTSTAINHTAGTSALINATASGANANSTRTMVGIMSSVTNTGTSSTNIALYLNASGATNNYGLIINAGRMGLGVTAPTAFLHILAGTTAASQIRLAAGVAPSSPNDGDIYYVDTSDRLMFRNSADVEFLLASAVNSVSPT